MRVVRLGAATNVSGFKQANRIEQRSFRLAGSVFFGRTRGTFSTWYGRFLAMPLMRGKAESGCAAASPTNEPPRAMLSIQHGQGVALIDLAQRAACKIEARLSVVAAPRVASFCVYRCENQIVRERFPLQVEFDGERCSIGNDADADVCQAHHDFGSSTNEACVVLFRRQAGTTALIAVIAPGSADCLRRFPGGVSLPVPARSMFRLMRASVGERRPGRLFVSNC